VTTFDVAARAGGIIQRLILLGVVVTGAALLVGALLLPTAIATDRAMSYVQGSVLDVPPLDVDRIERTGENSVVLAADGTLLAELRGEENRVLVSLDDIPRVAQNAVLATEDADFYTHPGVNHRAIVRAALTNFESGQIEQGGSTITQQYVKTKLLSNEQTLDRKIKEAIWAIELEKKLSKPEILERYLNAAYFGDGVYGIGTAARHYFSKHVSELNVQQAALLAGLIRSPQRNNPTSNPEAATARRNIVIEQMAQEGFITEEEAQEARKAPLGLKVQPPSQPTQPFFVEWVKQILVKERVDLQPDAQAVLGETEQERFRKLFEGGLVIHTSLDQRRQDLAEEVIKAYLDEPLEDPLGSLLTLDPANGAVTVMAIGPKAFGECPEGEKSCELAKFNPAVPGAGGSSRQPGSSFKPIIHAAALEQGFTPGYETETSSGQVIDGCGSDDEPYKVANYAGSGGGLMNMYEAAKRSNNVYHVKLARDTGIANVRKMAERLGIKHSPNLNERHFGSRSCSIGLGTVGVFPLEMASAYATLANHGRYCSPFAVTRIEDRQGKVLYEHADDCEQVLDSGIADRVTDIIQGPPDDGGTAPFVRDELGRPVAGKTGTTNEWIDAWFNGFVPQMVTSAWVGYEIPDSMFGVEAGGVTYSKVTGGSIPARMWTDYMVRALEGVPVKAFKAAPPIPEATVPNVVGMDESSARSEIEAKKFKVRTTTVTDYRPAGQVVGQSPWGGSSAWVGSIVFLQVSDGQGEPPLPEVPDVTGLGAGEAADVLEGAGYTPQAVEKETTDGSEVGVVIAQSPSGGTELESGSSVVIAIGKRAQGGGGNGGGGGRDTGGGDSDSSGGSETPSGGGSETPTGGGSETPTGGGSETPTGGGSGGGGSGGD
jgi:penicillin-binding protein 1A